MHSQSYRSLYVNLLLRQTLFGVTYGKMKHDEVVHKTKRVTVLHIASRDRMIQLFSIAGLCGVTYYKVYGHCHSCCGKVNCFHRGRHIIGYIPSESRNKWNVHLVNNKVIELGKVHCNRNGSGYKYPDLNLRNRPGYLVTQYWPVRFLVHSNGDCKFTLNRVTFDQSTKIVPQLRS